MHARTDPACVAHRPPRGRLGRWWFDRHRGRACGRCQIARVYAALESAAQDKLREEGRR